MSNVYRYKVFLPLFRQGNRIVLGNPSTPQSLSVPYTEDTLDALRILVKEGVSITQVNEHPLLQQLLDLEMIEEISGETSNRNDLYLKYINGRFLTAEEKKTKILIFGAGAGGSMLSYQLSQYGFSNLHLIDFDTVQQSDLSKSMVFKGSMIGELKTEAIKQRIYEDFGFTIDSYQLNINDYDSLLAYLKKNEPAFIIKACDPDGGFRDYLNEIAFQLRIPYMLMSYSFQKINVGPIYVPTVTGCDNYLNNLIVEKYGKEYANTVNSYRLFPDVLIHPSTSTQVAMLSSLVAKDIIHFVMGAYTKCKSIGRALTIDVETLQFVRRKVVCSDDCPVCSPAKIHAHA